jgi:hypothetical protein
LQEAADETQAAAAKPGMKAGATAEQLKKRRAKMTEQKKEFDEKAMDPLEHLAAIYPLLEDAARFTELYEKQKDLAERLASLKDQDHVEDPKQKARLRDLQEEQRRLREELTKLLDDIDDHVTKLPDDPRLNKLRDTATAFARDVRASGADEAMTGAEMAMGDFSGTRGHAGAKRAAEILEQFISRCNSQSGMGGMCLECLGFNPSLSSCLGNTVGQLLADAGLKSGMNGTGQGAGGGYSARRSSLNNVGLYGSLPTMNAQSGTGFSRRNQPGQAGNHPGGARRAQPTTAELTGHRNATGAAEAIIPAPYRKRVAEYFQRIIEETGGK